MGPAGGGRAGSEAGGARRTVQVGLTGGIGSGKSAVAELLRERGARIIDSDLLAREVVEPGTPGLAEIERRFGPGVLDAGRLDRPALGRIVFTDPQALADLNAIVHPRVIARARELAQAAPPGSVVVQVIPLLVETHQQDQFDEVVVVDVPESVQVERVVARDGLRPADATARIRAQATRAQRLAVATRVVDNTGSPQDLAARVEALWADLCRETGTPSRG